METLSGQERLELQRNTPGTYDHTFARANYVGEVYSDLPYVPPSTVLSRYIIEGVCTQQEMDGFNEDMKDQLVEEALNVWYEYLEEEDAEGEEDGDGEEEAHISDNAADVDVGVDADIPDSAHEETVFAEERFAVLIQYDMTDLPPVPPPLVRQ